MTKNKKQTKNSIEKQEKKRKGSVNFIDIISRPIGDNTFFPTRFGATI